MENGVEVVRELIHMMSENGLTELEVEREGFRVRLKRGGESAAAAASAAAPSPAAGPGAAPGHPAPAPAAVPDAGAGLLRIASPMVGTFYRARAPGAEPFVNVGDRVEPETVVCIIEAMKVMNEIKAEASGEVVKVLAGNAEAVEFGQPLFLVKPA